MNLSNFYFGGRDGGRFRTSKNLEELPHLLGYLLQEPCSKTVSQRTAGQVFRQIFGFVVFYPGHLKDREIKYRSEAWAEVWDPAEGKLGLWAGANLCCWRVPGEEDTCGCCHDAWDECITWLLCLIFSSGEHSQPSPKAHGKSYSTDATNISSPDIICLSPTKPHWQNSCSLPFTFLLPGRYHFRIFHSPLGTLSSAMLSSINSERKTGWVGREIFLFWIIVFRGEFPEETEPWDSETLSLWSPSLGLPSILPGFSCFCLDSFSEHWSFQKASRTWWTRESFCFQEAAQDVWSVGMWDDVCTRSRKHVLKGGNPWMRKMKRRLGIRGLSQGPVCLPSFCQDDLCGILFQCEDCLFPILSFPSTGWESGDRERYIQFCTYFTCSHFIQPSEGQSPYCCTLRCRHFLTNACGLCIISCSAAVVTTAISSFFPLKAWVFKLLSHWTKQSLVSERAKGMDRKGRVLHDERSLNRPRERWDITCAALVLPEMKTHF